MRNDQSPNSEKSHFHSRKSEKVKNVDHKNGNKIIVSDALDETRVPYTPYATALDEEYRRYLLVCIPGKPPVLIQADDIPGGGAVRELLKRGAPLTSAQAQAAFRRECDKVIVRDPSARVYSRPGFSQDLNRFIHGARIISEPKDTHAFVSNDSRLPASTVALSRCSGTLEGWKVVARGAVENPLFTFLLSLAFVGPINAICGHVNSTFLLSSRAATGKTAIGALATSVWGWGWEGGLSRLGAGVTFNNTENALIPHFACFRNQFAFIDELTLHAGGVAKPSPTLWLH